VCKIHVIYIYIQYTCNIYTQYIYWCVLRRFQKIFGLCVCAPGSEGEETYRVIESQIIWHCQNEMPTYIS